MLTSSRKVDKLSPGSAPDRHAYKSPASDRHGPIKFYKCFSTPHSGTNASPPRTMACLAASTAVAVASSAARAPRVTRAARGSQRTTQRSFGTLYRAHGSKESLGSQRSALTARSHVANRAAFRVAARCAPSPRRHHSLTIVADLGWAVQVDSL